MSELLSCPFCGSPGMISGRNSTKIECENAQCIIGSIAPFNDYTHRKDAIKAWNTRHTEAAKVEARWYCVDAIGAATLCTGEPDARSTAIQSDNIWPANAPHVPMQLVPVHLLKIPEGFIITEHWERACRESGVSLGTYGKIRRRATELAESDHG